MSLDNVQSTEQIDYAKNIDWRESPEEKKIFMSIENADWAIEKWALAEKLNNHFQFVSLMKELGRTAPDPNYISSEDVTAFVQKKFPSQAQQKELFGAMALRLKMQGIVYNIGSVSHDFSNIPITWKQKDVEFGMRIFAGDHSWAILSLDGESAAMPEPIDNDSKAITELRARNAWNRFDKAKKWLNDVKRWLKRTRWEKNRALVEKIPDLQSSLQVSLDSMAHATRDMLKKDPLARDKQTKYFLQHFYGNYEDYSIYFPQYERQSSYKQANQYDQRIQKLMLEIRDIQVDAWEKHMTKKHFGSFDVAKRTLTQTWLDDNFVPEKNSIKQRALQKAMAKWVPSFVEQYRQEAEKNGSNGVDAVLSLLDSVQYKMDQNNWQSTSLKSFYAGYVPLLQKSVSHTLETNKPTYEQHIRLFKLVTGRSLDNKKPEKTLIGQITRYTGPLGWANLAQDIAWYNSERIDDDVKNFDLAEQQLLQAGLYSKEWRSSLYDSIILQRKEAFGVPSQEKYNTLVNQLSDFTITKPDGSQESYDIRTLLGLDSNLNVNSISFEQLQLYTSLQKTVDDEQLRQLWPHTDIINLEIFFEIVKKHANSTQDELSTKLVSQLWFVETSKLPAEHQELHELTKDYYWEGGLFDISDRNTQQAKLLGKKIAVLGGNSSSCSSNSLIIITFFMSSSFDLSLRSCSS